MTNAPDPMPPDTSPIDRESEWIVVATATNLERDVLARSLEVPVLLDFWAPWCGPCKTLGPELERRAREGCGRFLLAKVDIDHSPELAHAFRVEAVPTVLAVVQGKIVDGFQGALPGAKLDEFLARIAPEGTSSAGPDALVQDALDLAAEGDIEAAIGRLREILRSSPDHHEARFALAELLVEGGKLREARLVVEKLGTDQAEKDRVRALQAKLDFAEGAGDLAELEERVRSTPDDLGARIDLARAKVASGDHANGFEHLLEVVRADQGELRTRAKAMMLEVFDILGLEDELANEYRFKLSLELFS